MVAPIQADSTWRKCRDHFWPWMFSTREYCVAEILRDESKRPFVVDQRHRWMWVPEAGQRGASVMMSWEKAAGTVNLHVSLMFITVMDRPSFDVIPEFPEEHHHHKTSGFAWVGAAEVCDRDEYLDVLADIVPGVLNFVGERSTTGGVYHFVAGDRARIERTVRDVLEAMK